MHNFKEIKATSEKARVLCACMYRHKVTINASSVLFIILQNLRCKVCIRVSTDGAVYNNISTRWANGVSYISMIDRKIREKKITKRNKETDRQTGHTGKQTGRKTDRQDRGT